MKVLITDGYYAKKSLENGTPDDLIYICGKNPGNAKELLDVLEKMKTQKKSEEKEAILYFTKIITKTTISVLSGEIKDVNFDLVFSPEVTDKIKAHVEKGEIFVPAFFTVSYRETEDENSNTDLKEREQELGDKGTTTNEVNDSKCISESPIVNMDRTEEILSISKNISFERDGLHFSKKQNQIFDRLFKSRNKYTSEEIAKALNLPIAVIRNKRTKFNKERDKNKDLSTEHKKAQDETTQAKEARNKEIQELAHHFVPEFNGRSLTDKSKEELCSLFSDQNRNWKISEIAKVTGLSRNIVISAFENKEKDQKEEQISETEALREQKKKEIEKEASFYRKNLRYDIRYVSNDQIQQYALEAGIIPSGDILTDSICALGIQNISKQDEDCLCIAFGCLQNFDTDFTNTLIAGNFSYMNLIQRLKPVCNMYKTLKILMMEKAK